MKKLLTIAQNTLTECLRQPIYAVILIAAIILYAMSPGLTMYTMDDDNMLLREICLSTLFLTCLFIAAFSASGVITDELEHKTITTVLSKPVSRPVFILAKFLGVAAAVTIAHFICTTALLMSIRHGVLETAGDTHDWTVIASGSLTILLTVVLSCFFSFSYGWRFTSTSVVLLTLFCPLNLLFLAFFDRNWTFNPAENHIAIFDIYASVLLLLAALIIVALAVAFSSRFNVVVTLSACVGIFLLGLVSDWALGRYADTNTLARLGYYLVPNLQVFWISDAIYSEKTVPLHYLGTAATYTASYCAAILAFAVAAFQRRQVG